MKMDASMERYVFITVGTTAFDDLVQTIVSEQILTTLVAEGYTKIILQTGRGLYEVNTNRSDIQIETYKFKDSIEDDLKSASLVISHAGAGSVLETLALNKPMIVVINDKLMDNHQCEIAEKMCDEGFLYYCTCDTLNETLKTKDLSMLKRMPSANPNLFNDYMIRLMNIEQ